MQRLLLVAVAIASLGVHAKHAGATLPGQNAELDRLYEQAGRLLDFPSERSAAAAKGILDAILQRDSQYAGAYVEYARLTLKSAFAQTRGPQELIPESAIRQARRLLETAIGIEPTFSDSYVLYGYVASLTNLHVLGLIALEEAERLGSTSGWLPLNRARILEMLGREDEAGDAYVQARTVVARGSPEDLAALDGILRVDSSVDAVDEAHRAMISLHPTSASLRADYARFLLRSRRYDEAVEYARRALSISPSASAHGVLGMAFYTKAADQLINRNDRVRAALYFLEGRRTDYPPTRAFLDSYAFDSTLITTFGLLEFGVDVNVRRGNGETLLFAAVRTRDDEYVSSLLEHGADPDSADENGETPLFFASASGSIGKVRLLLNAGANPNVTVRDIQPIDYAEHNGHPDVVRLLREYGAERSLSRGEQIAESVRDGVPGAVDTAIRFIQTEDSLDTSVVGALQDRFIEDPTPLLTQLGSANKAIELICKEAVDDALVATDVALQDAVHRADREANGGEITYALSLCYSSRRRAAQRGPQLEIPERPTSEQRRELLDRSLRLLDAADYRNPRFSDIPRIAFALMSLDPDDWEAHFLSAQYETFATPWSTTEAAQNQADQKRKIAADRLERVLRARPDLADAYALYGYVLLEQGYTGVANIMLARAETLESTTGWTELYRSDHLRAMRDYTGAERLLTLLRDRNATMRLRIAVLSRLIDAYVSLDRLDDADNVLDELVELIPGDTLIARRRLEYLLFERGDFLQAAQVGASIQDSGGTGYDMELAGLSMIALGASLLRTPDSSDEAIRWLREGSRFRQVMDDIILRASRHATTRLALPTLSEAGLSVNVSDEDGNTPLFHAVASGDPSAVAEILSLGGDVDAVNEDGMTPLHLAVLLGNEDVALTLLAAGASVWQGDSAGILRRLAEEQGLELLRARIEASASQRYPDNEAYADGLRRAWPAHVRRALAQQGSTGLPPGLEIAMINWPRTVLEIANSSGQLDAVCRSSGGEVDRLRAAVSRIRDRQLQLGLDSQTTVLDRCIDQLSRDAAD